LLGLVLEVTLGLDGCGHAVVLELVVARTFGGLLAFDVLTGESRVFGSAQRVQSFVRGDTPHVTEAQQHLGLLQGGVGAFAVDGLVSVVHLCENQFDLFL